MEKSVTSSVFYSDMAIPIQGWPQIPAFPGLSCLGRCPGLGRCPPGLLAWGHPPSLPTGLGELGFYSLFYWAPKSYVSLIPSLYLSLTNLPPVKNLNVWCFLLPLISWFLWCPDVAIGEFSGLPGEERRK